MPFYRMSCLQALDFLYLCEKCRLVMSRGKPLVCLKWFNEALDHDTSGAALIIWTAPSASLIINSVQWEFSSHTHLEVFFREHLSGCSSVRGKSVSAWLTAGIWRHKCRLQSCVRQVAKAPGRTKRVITCAVQPGYFRALLLVFCLIISVSALQAIRWMLSWWARADVIQRSTLMAMKQTVLSSNPWELSLCEIPFCVAALAM